MHSFESHAPDAGSRFVWSVRVRPGAERQQIASTRNHRFAICGAASFKENDPSPSSVEYLLGIVGGDLVSGFTAAAQRRGLTLFGLEAKILGHLHNPLFFLGVIGEEGHPGVQAIDATLYVSTEAEEQELEEAWQEVLRRSPLVHTLHRAVDLKLSMQLVQ
jgi:hypothetical protein